MFLPDVRVLPKKTFLESLCAEQYSPTATAAAMRIPTAQATEMIEVSKTEADATLPSLSPSPKFFPG